jgi:hypothetical protein
MKAAEFPAAALSVNVTAMVCGEPFAPAAPIVTTSLKVPAESPLEETVSPSVDGAVPDVADRVSHDCVLLAVQLSVPTPVLAIVTLCGVGFVKPAVAEKLTAFEETLNLGIAAFTIKVTPTVCGDDTAPGALTVTVSV